MYRSVALAALRMDVPMDDVDALGRMASSLSIEFVGDGLDEPQRVLLDGDDVTAAIRGPEATAAVSLVARIPAVREAMVTAQRRAAAEGDHVVEGRDIGTVVFPDASVKVYLTASADERARRRAADFEDAGVQVAREDVASGIDRRDAIDSSRAAAPLAVAEDALVLDTTDMTIDEAIDAVVARIGNARS